MPSTSTTTVSTRTAPRARLTTSLISQLSIGPAFREVASHLLREQLNDRYPSLNIDPDIVMVGTPSWEIVEGEITTEPPQYQALTDILARQAVLGVPTLFIDGVHFLTSLPLTEPPIHLGVRIEDISLIINRLAPVMLRGYQQQQLAFWDATVTKNGPTWHELSVILRNLWNIREMQDWSEEDCQIARLVSQNPDREDRAANDPLDTHAYVMDIDQMDDRGNVTHLNEHLVSVVTGKRDGHEVILVHSMLVGFRKYTSLDALGEDLPLLLDTAITHKEIQWRLLEPDGDFFDYLACTLIAMQIEAIGTIDFSDLRGQSTSKLSLAGPPGAVTYGRSPGQDINWLQQALPDWLADAPISDMNSYSRHLKNLSALHTLYQGRSYNEGIAPIGKYALERLEEEILKDHPDATDLSLETLCLEVKSPLVWGLFPIPGKFVDTSYTMEQLALQNLIAVPLGIKTLEHKPPHEMPEWFTVDYLEQLISRINVGSNYPELIKSTLLDDPAEATRRIDLYTQHLHTQLPLMALQAKIRGEAGIDERGRRFVSAAVALDHADRQVDGVTIVIRPLALLPSLRLQNRTPDVVENMFVIGPQDIAAGPCLLYRPLLEHPLSQYPSPANLIYAIQQSPDLRESVLAWLPDDVRDDYSHYVFPTKIPSPWAVVGIATSPLKLATLSGPLKLGGDAINGDLFTSLYKANANALITLADRQSVSNSEARWATFKRAGWAIFNGVLPFLGRAAGTAAWVWQIMDQLEELKEAKEHPKQQSTWTALADLLLNLGMAIALHAAARTAPRPSIETKTKAINGEPSPSLPEPEPEPKPEPKPITINQLPTLAAEKLPYNHPRPLHTSGALNRTPQRLGALLDTFKVNKPSTLGEQITAEGPHHHLYPSGEKYYVPVGERWFEVQVDENDRAIIVDSTEPQRTGPPLIHNIRGEWFVDTRLRLRGGVPRVLVQRAASAAEERIADLDQRLRQFQASEQALQRQVRDAYDDMTDSRTSLSKKEAESQRKTYLRALSTNCRRYEEALQLLKTKAVFGYIPKYSEEALKYLQNQINDTTSGIKETNTQFAPRLRKLLPKIVRQAETPQERYIDEAYEIRDLCSEMRTHLEYMETRINELKLLGADGAAVRKVTEGNLPIFTSTDLRALQVTIARNLALSPNTTVSQAKAWKTIDRIVNAADIAVLSLRDVVYERSESRLDERIEILNHLVEQFQILDERLDEVVSQRYTFARVSDILNLRNQLRDCYQDAVDNLTMVSEERDAIRTRDKPLPEAPRPVRKIIRTRHDGVLIGKPRLDRAGEDTNLVDIISSVTDTAVATYHEKDGIWLKHMDTPPTTPEVDVLTATRQGQALLDDMDAFLERAERLATAEKRVPSGIEYLYRQQAYDVESARILINHALAQGDASSAESTSAKRMEKTLKVYENNLFDRGEKHMRRLLKESPPTVSGVEWLKRRNAITIKQTLVRKKLEGLPKQFYLDEFVIRDQETKNILWYAQFHYTEHWIPEHRYVSGRLKTVEEHRAGATAGTEKGTDAGTNEDTDVSTDVSSPSDSAPASDANGEQKLAYLRSEISLKSAQSLFFAEAKKKLSFFSWLQG